MGLDDVEDDNITSASSAHQWESAGEGVSEKESHSLSSQMLILTVGYTPGLNDSSRLGRKDKVVLNTSEISKLFEDDQLGLLSTVDPQTFPSLQCSDADDKKSTVTSHLLLVKGQYPESSKDGMITLSKSYLESLLNREFLIAPLPESVVNTDLTKELLSEDQLKASNQIDFETPAKDSSLFEFCVKSGDTLLKNLEGVSCIKYGNDEVTSTLSGLDDCVINANHHGSLSGEAKGSWESDSDTEGHVISDKPVKCRARASLPGKYLYFLLDSNKSVIGVCAREAIPRKSRFGPVEGSPALSNFTANSSELSLSILVEDKPFFLSLANEHLSNWMCYVRPATCAAEQNMNVVQLGDQLFFVTSKEIQAKEELRVWYGRSYAEARKLPLFSDAEEETHSRSEGEACLSPELMVTDSVKGDPLKENLRPNILKSKPEEARRNSMKSGEPDLRAKGLTCSNCFKHFENASNLNLHMLTHAADDLENESMKAVSKVFRCKVCSRGFPTNSALNCHTKYHSEDRRVECPICKKYFENVLGLKAHIPSHVIDGFYNCSHCSKKFSKYRNVRKHIRTFHSGRMHHCTTCPKKFITLDKLKLHVLSHSDHRPFICQTCGKRFKRKDKLSTHIKNIHFSEVAKQVSPNRVAKPHKKTCVPKPVECLEDFNRYVYKCHVCILGFKRRGMLVNHLANRHPEISPESVPELKLPILRATKDYFCQYCDKIYKSSSKRKAHILKNHPGEQLPLSDRHTSTVYSNGEENGTFSQTVGSVTTDPHGCPWCHKQYASKAKLLQHQRKKHTQLLPKSLQIPKRFNSNNSATSSGASATISTDNKEDTDSLVQDPLEIFQDLEVSGGSSNGDGDVLIDAATLRKTHRVPKKPNIVPSVSSSEEASTSKDEGESLLHDPMELLPYFEVSDSHATPEGEFLIDSATLKKALRGELALDYSTESVAELSQLTSDSRSEQYFRVYQTANGLTFAHTLDIWDPYTFCQSLDQTELDSTSSLTSYNAR